MLPPHKFTWHGPSSPGTPQVPRAQPWKNPGFWPTSSPSIAPGQHPSAPGTPSNSLPMKGYEPAAEPCRTDVPGIADLPLSPWISFDESDADHQNNNTSELGVAEGNAPIRLKQMEFSLMQFDKKMGQPTFSTFNKWKKLWVAGGLEKKHWSIIPWQNCLKQCQDGNLHSNTAVADFWRLSRPGGIWKPLLMPNGFGDTGLEWFRWNVQARFMRKEAAKQKQQATSDRFGRADGQQTE